MNDILHIYQQELWHGKALIIGDKEALIQLREQINRAIGSSESACQSYFQNDGEGFNLYVKEVQDDVLNTLPSAYLDDIAAAADDEIKALYKLVI